MRIPYPALRLVGVLLLAAVATGPAAGQTFTSASTGTFTNLAVWNFGAGPIPASNPAGVVTVQNFGGTGPTVQIDPTLTLGTLNIDGYGVGSFSTTSLLTGGGFAFAGTGAINLNGSGGAFASSAATVIGSTATGLTVGGAGRTTLTVSAALQSNTAAGAPLTVNLASAVPGQGQLTLNGTNTFAGGVALSSGTLSIGSASALGTFGSSYNTLTVTGGALLSSVTTFNPVVANADLLISGAISGGGGIFGGAGSAGLLGLGGISGTGGLTQRLTGGSFTVLQVANTYTGATTVAGLGYATTNAPSQAGVVQIRSAAGSVLNTSGFTIRDGGALLIDKASAGDSNLNARVSTGAGIAVNSGFLNVIGTTAYSTQSFGTVTGTGTTNVGLSASGGSAALTVANLVRTAGATAVFSGANLGATAATPGGTAANIVLTQINGAAPAAALSAGALGTPAAGILPWALADTVNPTTTPAFTLGTNFATYDTFGVRPLAATEYSTVAAAGALVANTNNRVTGAPAAQNTNITVNSLYNTGSFNISGSGTIDISTGALAGTGLFTVVNPVTFGGGTGEAVVTVLGAIGTANTITMNSAMTGSRLVKAGNGTLSYGSTSSFSSNEIVVNGGFVATTTVASLGIANAGTSSLTFNLPTQAAGGGLVLSGGANTLNVPVTVNSGTAYFAINGGGSLTLAGLISGAGGVGVNGGSATSTLTLTNTGNTYQGGTRFAATLGTVLLPGDAVLGAAAGPVTFASNSQSLRLTGNWTTGRNIGFEANLGTSALDGFDTAGFNSTWAGPIVGNSSIFKVDSGVTPGVWSITGANNPYTGTIQIGNNATAGARPGGTLALVGAGDLNSASLTFGPAVAGAAGTYALDLSAATGPGAGTPWRSFAAITTNPTLFAQPHSIQLGTSAGAPVDLRLASGTLGSGTAPITVAGFGKLVKTGTGTLTLTNGSAFTFTGGVEIWGGTLAIPNDAALGNAANGVLLQGGTLSLGANISSGRTITLGATPVPLTTNPANAFAATGAGLTHTGLLTGPGGFTRAASGNTISITGQNNTYQGGTVNAGGVLSFAYESGMGTGYLRLGGGTTTVGASELAPFTSTRPIYVSAASTLNAGGSNAWTLAGPLVGSAALTLGGNAVVLNNPSPLYTGALTFTGGTPSITGGTFPRATLTVNGPTLTASNPAAAPLVREFNAVNLTTGTIDLGSTNPVGLAFGFATGTTSVWTGNVTGGSNAAVTFHMGTLNVNSSTSTFAGGFTNLGGTVTFGSGVATGTLPLQAAFTLGGWGDISNAGPTTTLNNTTAAADRIADGQAVYANNAALVFTTNTTTATTETAASLRGAGYSTVTMSTGGTLSFADATNGLTRVNRGTFLLRSGATTFGTAVASASSANLLFANAAGQLVGGSGGAGTTTVPILPFAVGGTSSGSTGNTFVTYGANGIRPLDTSSEYLNTFTAATADTNVRFGGSSTIGGNVDQSVNSFLITGTANTGRFDSATTEKLIVTSGAIANTIAQVYNAPNAYSATAYGLQMAEIQTGLGNSRELIFHTQAADLAVNSLLSTSGGVTKSGTGNLYVTRGSNSYTGGTTVNGGNLVIDSLATINDSATQTLTLSGGFLRYRGANATLAGPVVIGGGSAANVGSSGGLYVTSGTTLTIAAGKVSGFGGLLKDGTGTLVLGGDNSYSGATILNAGTLAIATPGALGTNPRVVVGTAGAASATSGGVFRFDAPMTLSQDFVQFGGIATNGFNFDTNGNSVTLTGVVSGPVSTRGLNKFGAGDLLLTNTQLVTGAVQVFGGTLTLGGANGSALLASGTGGFLGASAGSVAVNAGAGLVLDNSVTNNNNRLPDIYSVPTSAGDAASTGLQVNGGEFRVVGNATVPTFERLNRVNVLHGTVTLVNNGQNVSIATGRVFRGSGQTVALVRGTNLGDPVGPGSTNWFSNDQGSGSTQTAGAGGAIGTPFVSIVPGFVGDRSAAGGGTDLMTYDTAVGFRLLAAGEYTNTIPTLNLDGSRAPNVAVTGTLAAPATPSYVTALRLAAGATLAGTGTVNVTQSTVLAVGTSSIAVPTLQSIGNGGYCVFVAGGGSTLTLGSDLNGGSLVKGGDGTLAFGGTLHTASTVVVQGGTLALTGANAQLAPFGGAVTVAAGASLTLGGQDRTISNLAGYAAVGNFNPGIAQDGAVNVGANRLTLTDLTSGSFSGQLVGPGTLARAEFASGSLALTQPQPNFTGTLQLRGGGLTLAGQGSVLNAALIDIRGGTLFLTNSNDVAGASGLVQQRLGATTPITLAGTINLTANSEGVANHLFGPTTLVGAGSVSATSTAAPSTLTFANVAQSAGRGFLTLSGTNLGVPLAPNAGTNVFATQINGGSPAAALVGGGGTAGTTTVSVLPWAMSGNTYLTYGANGFRPLDTAAEYSASITAGATANVRTTAAATLAAATEVNSLVVTNGNVTGPFDLTVASGGLTVGTTATIGTAGQAIKTGVGGTNTADLYLNASSGTTTLAANVTTAGALVKAGAGTLTLTGTNAYGGGTYIHNGAVNVASQSNLSLAGPVVMGAANPGDGANVFGLTYTGTGVLTLPASLSIQLPGTGGLAATNAGGVLVVNGVISGPGGLTVGGGGTVNGVVELNGANTFTGAVSYYSSSGQTNIVSINGDAALGAGPMVSVNSSTPDPLFLRGDWATTKIVRYAGAYPINTGGYAATWGGYTQATSGFLKDGAGALTITAPGNFGAVTVNGGDLILRDRGATGSTGGFTLNAGTRLVLDDRGTHHSDRLPDNGGTVTMTGAGLALVGSAGVTADETINNVSLSSSFNTITAAPGAGQAATLRLLGTFTRSSGSGVLVRGDNLGQAAPGSAGTGSVVLFTPASSLALFTGGGGAAGTAYVSVVPGGFADASSTGLGSGLLAYDLANGFRALTAAETTTTLVNGTVTADNLRLTGASAAVANATMVNSLWLDNGGTLTLGGASLTITTGSVLAVGTGNVINATTSVGTAAFAVGGSGDLTVNNPITGSGGLIKSGAGTLNLPGLHTLTGSSTLAAGTLNVGNALSLGTSSLRVLGGTLGSTAAAPLTLANNVTLTGDVTLAAGNGLTLSGTVLIDQATRTVAVTGANPVTLSGVVSNNKPGAGLVKAGSGTLVLGSATGNTYATTSNFFYEAQTTVAAGTLRLTNTSGSATGGTRIVVRPEATLSGTGFAVPAQLAESRNTVAVLGGGTLSPGVAGPGRLTFGNSATPGITMASVSLAAGSVFAFDYTGTPAAAAANTGTSLVGGTGNDQVAVNGTLAVDSGAIFKVSGTFADFTAGTSYSFNVGTTTAVNGFNITSPSQFDTSAFAGYTSGVFALQWTSAGTTVYFNLTPVPEPATVLLVAGVAAAAARGWRRKPR